MKKQEDLAEIGYQLRTLMNSTIGMLELSLLSDNLAEQKEYQHIALSSAHKAMQLVNNLLEASPHSERATVLNKGDSKSRTKEHLSVLVAEDNPINQKIVSRILERRGHKVTLAKNGREAVNALASAQFDIVLMDLRMPEMDGWEAMRIIREREENTKIRTPIIVMSATEPTESETSEWARFLDGYLPKPFEPKTLIKIIGDILGQ